ncbi:YceI family protein [Rhizosaccharibacter radicis]|uniref:YceI family protein n=1 Tax=Rhizosaccharibacter radicis TaxID=2782605 RepID=A0ABT1VX71_9PROT|nr:YceI family protein [Acetobacteraceae bacterium KSS12]
MSFRRSLAAAVFGLAAASTGALAQSASHDPATVKGGSYTLEPTHTQIGWTLSHMGFSYYSGGFSNASGSLTLDPANPTADKLNVSVPIASVATTSTKLDGELKSAQWFDADKFPTATFASTGVTAEGKDRAKVTGTLTLHGVTRPVVLDVRFVGAGVNPLDKKYTVGFEAVGTIRRSDFGVKTYVPLIGDEVRLTINGAFEQQS